jgi:PAS domain S-box-containing protein
MAETQHAWTLHGEYPEPYILFQCVRSETGALLDFQWRALNPAAEPLVRGLSRALSAWSGVDGMPTPGMLREVVDGGASLSFELHVRGGSGERWFRARALKQGDGFELWLSDWTDAHEKQRSLLKALERERRALERERKAREREAYLSLALEAAHMVTWEWSEERGTFSLSANAESFFGEPPDGLGNTVERFLHLAHPEERLRIAEAFERMRSTEGSHSFEFHGQWPDGTVHCYEVVGQSFHEEGHPLRVLGVALDCTERKNALEELKEEARFRERFIGILGHDLRTPLHAIALSARELGRRGLPVLHQKLLQRIESSAARMGNMISDILDLTRARLSGRIPLHLSSTSLPLVCQQVVEEMKAVYPERTLLLDFEGTCEGVWDWERLAQVVSNLVGNALEHTPLDTPVRVRCREEGAAWRVLEISNSGPPIANHLLATLFDPFRQAGPARTGRGSGLGLGLYIVHQLVLAHQGVVSVHSTGEQGTTFTVRLPRDARDVPPASSEALPVKAPPPFRWLSRERPTE